MASLVQSLAWPICAVIGAALFRKPLEEALRRGIHRLKAGPFEMELFDRTLATTEAETDPIPLIVGPPSGADSSLSAELGTIIEASPAAAVMEAHARVERRLREMLEGTGLAGSRPQGIRQLARDAAASNLISSESVRAIDGITVMRNLAAHGTRGDVTPDRAVEYVSLAEAILYALQQPPTRRETNP